MKILALASLVFASVAGAGPAPHGPDFVGSRDPRWLDRSTAASEGHGLIEPSDIVFYGLDRWALDEASQSQVDATAQWLRAHPDHRIVLEGHTDILGSTEYNLALGRRRAEHIRDRLIGAGIDSDRILVVVIGEADAHYTENPADRRVVMFASTLPLHALAAAELDTKPVASVAWTDRGSRLEEHNGLAQADAIARR